MYNHWKEYNLKNNDKLLVRSPRVEDAQALINHMIEVDKETEFLAREAGEFNLTVDREKSFIENTLNNPNVFFFVAELNGEIVANCSVGFVMGFNKYKHRAAMGIAIRKAHWGKGIGQILMQECMSWCKTNNVEQLELDVVTGNKRAVALYEKMGFEVFGTKKHALKYSDGRYADEFYMIHFIND